MAAAHSFLDIHICGPCRSEFSDIYKFIQHKKECYLSGARVQGQASDVVHLTEQCIQQLQSSDVLELQLEKSEYQPETYQYISGIVEDHLANENSCQISVVQNTSVPSILNTTEDSVSDCAKKNSEHLSYPLNLQLMSEHKKSDLAMLYSYAWPLEDVKSVPAAVGHLAENETMLLTDIISHKTSSVNAEKALSQEVKSNLDISTDNIAVYVMSPRSFASSIRTSSKSMLDHRNKSLSEFNTGSVWSNSESDTHTQMLNTLTSAAINPTSSSRRIHISYNDGDKNNDLMCFEQENSGLELIKSTTGSSFCGDLVLSSNNSTPCPEDLEVGHISAGMFGKRLDDDFKIIINLNNNQEHFSNKQTRHNKSHAFLSNSKAHLSKNQTHHSHSQAHLNNSQVLPSNVQVHLNNGKIQLNNNQHHLNSSQSHLNTSQTHLNSNQSHLNTSQSHLNTNQSHLNTNQSHLNNSQVNLNNIQASITAPVISQSDSDIKALLCNDDSLSGYIVENTPDTLKEIDVSNKQKIYGEKQERLQGVSEDIQFSSLKSSKGNAVKKELALLQQAPTLQVTNGNITSKPLLQTFVPELPSMVSPTLTSFKAIFTSPSCGGHRLITAQPEKSELINYSTQGFSNLKKLFYSTSDSLVSKSVEYKNISASIQHQSKEQEQLNSNAVITGQELDESKINCDINHVTEGASVKKSVQTPKHNFAMSTVFSDVERNSVQTFLKSAKESNTQLSVMASSSSNPRKLLLAMPKIIGLKHESKPDLSIEINATGSDLPKIEAQKHNLKTDYSSEFNIAGCIVPKIEEQRLQSNTDFCNEVSTACSATHNIEESPLLVIGNLDSVSQICTDKSYGKNFEANSKSELKVEQLSVSQRHESLKTLSTPIMNGTTSVVMLYKNNDGNIIMIPNIVYNSVQNNSQTAEVVQIVRTATGQSELPTLSSSQNANQAESQATDSSIYLDLINPLNTQSIVSQNYYIQNIDATGLLLGQALPTTNVPSSGSSFPCNQTTNISHNNNQQPTRNKLSMLHKTQVLNNGQNDHSRLDKEKCIIKPKNTDGSKNSTQYPVKNLCIDAASNKDILTNNVTSQVDRKKIRTFACKFELCRYTTGLFKDFQRHCRQHTGEKPYKCSDCGTAFNRSDKLKLHQRRHAGLKPFQCQLCDYAAIDSGSLKKHMRIHTDERPFKCQICTYASRNSSQLIVHLRTHTGDSPFQCTKCEAKFKINSDLKRHMRIHTGEKPFQCDKCNYKSSNKGNLKTHLRINHLKENEIHCPSCKFVTSSKKRLREHAKCHNVQVMKCLQCDYTCANSSQLKSHIIIHNSLKPFQCNYCSYSSKQSGNLKKHIHNMHSHKTNKDKSKISVTEIPSRIKPNSSKKENSLLPITERSAIHRHRNVVNLKKLHVCEQCGSNFVRQDSLRCHQKQHCKTTEKIKISNEQTQQGDVIKDTSQNDKTGNKTSSLYHQGIQQIVAAASKIYEENYGSQSPPTKSPSVNMSSIVLNKLPDLNPDSSQKDNQICPVERLNIPEATTSCSETGHQKTTLFQIPCNVPRTYTFSADGKLSLPQVSSVPSSSSSLNSPTKKQFEFNTTKSLENVCNKKLIKGTTENVSLTPQKRQTTKINIPSNLLKSRRIIKCGSLPVQSSDTSYKTISQSNHDNSDTHLIPQKDVSTNEFLLGSTTETTVYLTQQLPQKHSHLPVGTMNIKLEPAAHIQIMKPGIKSGQLIREQGNIAIPHQQILLQVQDNSEESHLFAIPTGNLNTLPITDQMLPNILSHCLSQETGLVDLQAITNTDAKSSYTQTHLTSKLNENIFTLLNNNNIQSSKIIEDDMIFQKDSL